MPAAGDTLRRSPGELRLVFSEAVLPRYTSLQLFAPDGRSIRLGPLQPDAAQRQYQVPPPRLRVSGQYRVEWRSVSADGHVATGAFTFTLLLPPASPAPPVDSAVLAAARQAETDRLRQHHVDPQTLPEQLLPGSPLNAGARLLQLAAILALIGAASFRALLLPGAALMPTVHQRVTAGVRRFAAAALVVLLLTLPLRLWLQSAALHGPELAFDLRFLGILLTQLPWGHAWLAQAAFAALAGLGVLTGFTPLLALAASALAFTPAFQGHAAAVDPLRSLALAADGVHVLAAGAWIGTLAVLVSTAIPALFRHGLERGGHDTARLLQRFSPLAIAAAALLAAAGTLSAALHLHSPVELVTTAWGRTLLGKLALVLAVLLAGWFNWKRARPALPAHGGVRALRLGAFLELLFAAAALAVTAFLVALPTP